MPDEVRYQHYGGLLYWIDHDLRICQRSIQEQEQLIDAWAIRFDHHPTEAPHADFLRLIVLAHRGEKQAAVDLLNDLRKRYPDSRQFPWSFTVQRQGYDSHYACTASMVKNLLPRIEPDADRREAFTQWLEGE